MAKLTGTVPGFPVMRFVVGEVREAFDVTLKKQEAALKVLEDRSESLPKTELVGAVIRFQIADGYALYLVTKVGAKSVELQHIPYCDGYQIPAAHLRGLTKADIIQQVNAERRMAALFRKKG